MHKEAGFTLLEVLVAFAIVTMSTLALAGVVRTGLASANEARDRALAYSVAQSLLAQLGGSSLKDATEFSGVAAPHFAWHATARSPGGALNNDPIRIYWIEVSVYWSGNRGTGRTSITLRSARLGEEN